MSCKWLQKHHCGVYPHECFFVSILQHNITSQYVFEIPQVTNEKKKKKELVESD